MKREGAPLYFLGTVLGGWTAARVALLWPGAPLHAITPPPLRPLAEAIAGALIPEASALIPDVRDGRQAATFAAPIAPGARMVLVRAPILPASPSYAAAPAGVPPGIHPHHPLAPASYGYGDPPIPAPLPASATGSRLSASAWFIARSGGAGTNDVVTPQLGGGQAGVRFAYALGGSRRLAATLRVAGATASPEREIAPGVEWRIPGAPLRLFAEQRVALARGRGGTTVGVIAGLSRQLPAGFSLEGYAQGGVIARDGGEGFADGAIRASRPVAQLGAVSIDLGAASWGAAQKGASRLDLGPTLGIGMPVAGRRLRFALDWRERVAGNARPASGPALSLGADF